jgi:hypothetical protein
MYRLHHSFRALLTAVLASLPSFANAGSDYSPDGCDFAVTFPVQPVLVRGQMQGLQTVMAKTPENYAPFLRAECIAMDPKAITEEAVRRSLVFQANAMGITNPMVNFEKTPIGTLGYVNGTKRLEQFNYTIILKTYRGTRSILNLILVDEIRNYPSHRSTEFFASVRKIKSVKQ